MLNTPPLTIDFTDKAQVADWYIVNDGVMGGLSKGSAQLTDEGIRFAGTVSLDNNGGFSALRSPTEKLDLSAYKTVAITYKSTGVRKAFQFSNTTQFYLPKYKIALPLSEDWNTVTVRLREVEQYRMGNKTGAIIEESTLKEIVRLGFITNEKRSGEFALEVKQIVFE